MTYTKVERKSTKHQNGGWFSEKREVVTRYKEEAVLIDEWITENNTSDIDNNSDRLLEKIVDAENISKAIQKVVAKKGCPGVDGMTVERASEYFLHNGKSLLKSIKEGKYKPAPVLRVEIPKDNGTMRKLGVPTVVDRIIQQAIAYVLTPIFEPKFVETSYGFRPKRSAHQAIRKCLEYLNNKRVYTVDMDLEKFFDTVNQSKLIQVLSDTIKDGRVISLINKFLRAGVVTENGFEKTSLGVPQGGPLSPILANIMLNELDHELERRGHTFVRYADDMVIFCKSKASAKQTLEHITPYIEKKLFLKINREKTKIAHARDIEFIGFGFYYDSFKDKCYKCKIGEKAKKVCLEKVKELTSRKINYSKSKWQERIKLFAKGWINYFKIGNMKTFLKQVVDPRYRRRIRMVIWKRWKLCKTRFKRLVALGIKPKEAKKYAYSRQKYWHMSKCEIIQKALNDARLTAMGFMGFTEYYLKVVAMVK